jgi:hypothetical protein
MENHRLTLPNGMSYALMVLPPLETMTPALLQKIRQLVTDGANIMGVPPQRSPGMAGYPESDDIVRSLAGEMWGTALGRKHDPFLWEWQDLTTRESFGGIDVAASHSGYHPVRPGFNFMDPSPERCHRDVFPEQSKQQDSRELMADFRVQDKQPELWDAVTGEQRLLPEFTSDARRTQRSPPVCPGESYYLVFSDKPQRRRTGRNFPDYEEVADLSESWQVRFDPELKGPQEPVEFRQLTDWSTHENEQIRFYSGPAVYARTIQLEEPAEGERLLSFTGQGLAPGQSFYR